MSNVFNFTYTGSPQEVILQPGKYKLECWGTATDKNRRSYSKGEIMLTEETPLYVYVGGFNCWNGGGKGSYSNVINGGDSTDIRIAKNSDPLNATSLLERFIVAGGCYGRYFNDSVKGIAYSGGGLISEQGSDNYSSAGQSGGGIYASSDGSSNSKSGSFGKGGIGTSAGAYGGGGGGGWYGGNGTHTAQPNRGSGGSGYVLTKDSIKPNGYRVGEKFYLTNAITVKYDEDGYVPYTSTTDGFCKITQLIYPPNINIIAKNRNEIDMRVVSEFGTLTKVEIYVNTVLKQTSTNGFDNITFTFDVSDNTYVLGDNEIKIIAYDEVNELSTTHLENYKNIIDPPVIPENPSLKQIIDVYDGIDSCMNYQLVELSNQLKNKGVSTSENDGMTNLVSKVSNLSNTRYVSGEKITFKEKGAYTNHTCSTNYGLIYSMSIGDIDFKDIKIESIKVHADFHQNHTGTVSYGFYLRVDIHDKNGTTIYSNSGSGYQSHGNQNTPPIKVSLNLREIEEGYTIKVYGRVDTGTYPIRLLNVRVSADLKNDNNYIDIGKKWASGISSRSASVRKFSTYDTSSTSGSSASHYYLLVEGLDFTPSSIISYVEYNGKIIFNFACNIKELYSSGNYSHGSVERSLYSYLCYNTKLDNSAYIVDNSFLIPIPINSSSVKVRWYAYE